MHLLKYLIFQKLTMLYIVLSTNLLERKNNKSMFKDMFSFLNINNTIIKY